MLAQTSRHLYRYWNGLRANRRAPRRFDIEPVRISRELPDTFILEEAGGGAFRFRLAGTRVVHAFGRDLRGQPFDTIWAPESLAVLTRVLGQICRQANVGVLAFSAPGSNGSLLEGELILLPLLHSDDKLSRVLGGVTINRDEPWTRPARTGQMPASQPARQPASLPASAFAAEQIGALSVSSVGLLWPDAMTMLRGDVADEQMANELPILRPELAQARIVRAERRAFRIVDGGRTPDAG